MGDFTGDRLGQPIDGIDTPTLLGLHANERFLHSALADSISEVFSGTMGTYYPALDANFLAYINEKDIFAALVCVLGRIFGSFELARYI